MKTMLLIFALILSSCTYATKEKIIAFGGKGFYRSKGEEGFTLGWQNEKSFGQGMMALQTGIMAGSMVAAQNIQAGVDKASISADVAKHKATQETARHTTTEAAKLGSQSISTNGALEIGSNPVGVIKAVKP